MKPLTPLSLFLINLFEYTFITLFLSYRYSNCRRKEIYREQFDFCINQVSNIMLKYGLNTYNTKILVDASVPSVVSIKVSDGASQQIIYHC